MATLSNRIVVAVFVLLVFPLLAGCRPITAEGSLAAAPAAPVEAVAPVDAAAQARVDAAIGQAAVQRGVDAGSLKLVSVEEVEWPDASLGCPEDDMMYAQVITPGYRILLDAEGQLIEVHTDAQQPPEVVICAP
jgi:hypothetical protein